MSHGKERHEKICLNCNASLIGPFCHVCGQENTEPKESIWSIVNHFFADITHFDGKFFSTLRYLITRPGFLTKEYFAGRRASYLHPIRMYVFTSAIFFLVFFSIYDSGKKDPLKSAAKIAKTEAKRKQHQDAYFAALSKAKTATDSAVIKKAFSTMTIFGFDLKIVDDPLDKAEKKEKIISKFVHTFPYLLFVSLPMYALILQLLYIRRRKQFFYAGHAMFLIHLYIFTFIFLLVVIGLDNAGQAAAKAHIDWLERVLDFLEGLLFIPGIWYTWKAMRTFYGQSRGITTLKFLALNLLCFTFLAILFTAFFIFAVFRV